MKSNTDNDWTNDEGSVRPAVDTQGTSDLDLTKEAPTIERQRRRKREREDIKESQDTLWFVDINFLQIGL